MRSMKRFRGTKCHWRCVLKLTVTERTGRMYTLRARSGSSNTKQTTIDFRCRKRRQSARSKDQANTNNENSFSPPKRTKSWCTLCVEYLLILFTCDRPCSLLLGTRSDTKTPAGCRSPLKEQNVAPEEQGEEECCMSTSTKTPAARGEWSIRPDMLLGRLTQCFVTVLPTCGCRLSNFGRSSGPSNIGYDLSDPLGLFRDGFWWPSSHIARQAVTWNVLVESWILQ